MPDAFLFIIIGGTGDLARRKLLPAWYRIVERKEVPEGALVLGVSRSNLDDVGYREQVSKALHENGLGDGELQKWCDQRVFFQPLPTGDPAEYKALADRIAALEKEHGLPGNRIFYLSIPPEVFDDTIEGLGAVGLNSSPGWTRIVIEKPFGSDLQSAQRLNALVHRFYSEDQIYRIDHYLGKETVQNLLAFRFSNPVFEAVWNRDRVERVEIIVAEDLGIEGRAGYYDQTGVMRDMIQNHLTQLMTLVAMEVPARMDAEAIRQEKVKVLRSVEPIDRCDLVLGQYAAGKVGGKDVPAYRAEKDVPPESGTATFAALKISIANWRWQGVPFVLRTGKRLPRRLTQIAVVFRRPPVRLFDSVDRPQVHPNVLLITIQPDEGFYLGFEVKVPGDRYVLQKEYLHFSYAEAFGRLREAYETLLHEICVGDQTLFVHADEAEASWEIYTPLLQNLPDARPYAAGSWGPPTADELLEIGEDDYMVPAIEL